LFISWLSAHRLNALEFKFCNTNGWKECSRMANYLQGITVAEFIKTIIQSKMMNATTMIPCMHKHARATKILLWGGGLKFSSPRKSRKGTVKIPTVDVLTLNTLRGIRTTPPPLPPRLSSLGKLLVQFIAQMRKKSFLLTRNLCIFMFRRQFQLIQWPQMKREKRK